MRGLNQSSKLQEISQSQPDISASAAVDSSFPPDLQAVTISNNVNNETPQNHADIVESNNLDLVAVEKGQGEPQNGLLQNQIPVSPNGAIGLAEMEENRFLEVNIDLVYSVDVFYSWMKPKWITCVHCNIFTLVSVSLI